MKVSVLLLLSAVVLNSCAGGGAAYEFYVVVEPGETTKFRGAITAIAKEDGLETAEGQSVSDTGDVFRLVEGRGHGLKLWVQDTPLSGKEDPELCGVHHEPHADPAQFTVFTEPRFFGSRTAATQLGDRVFFQLEKAGYDVRRKPVICGSAALHVRS